MPTQKPIMLKKACLSFFRILQLWIGSIVYPNVLSTVVLSIFGDVAVRTTNPSTTTIRGYHAKRALSAMHKHGG